MRPFYLAALIILGLAALATAVLIFQPHSSVDGSGDGQGAPVALSFHRQTPGWTVVQRFEPGAEAIRFRFELSLRDPGDRLIFRVHDREGRLLHQAPVARNGGKSGWASWDGILAGGGPLAPGRYELELVLERNNRLVGRSARMPFTVLNVDLDVDADRDGAVTEADEKGEDSVTPHSGAYFAVNFDADGGRQDEEGRLLSDSVVFDDMAGQPTRVSGQIENEADADGLAPLVIRGFGGPLLAGIRVFLRVGEREDIESVQIYPRREAGVRKIWGGLGSREGRDPLPTEIDITRLVDPASPDFAGRPGESGLTFAVEGLFFRNDPKVGKRVILPYPIVVNPFDGDIDLFLEIRHTDKPGKTIFSDHVRMRVVPWLMFPHTNRSVAVFARDAEEENEVLLTKGEEGYFDLSSSGQLVIVRTTAKSEEYEDLRWLQDHTVLGGYHLPGAAGSQRTYAALRLPYEVEEDLSQPKWVAEHLTGADRGVFQFGSWLGPDHGAEDRANGGHGGNIDVIPPSATYPLGRIVIGDTMPGGLRVFFKSQRVQPVLTLPTRWLAVGHIDEMIGFTGQGGETVIADPVLAYRLLEAIPEEKRGTAVFFAKGGPPLAGTVQAAPPGTPHQTEARRLYTGVDHRGSRMHYVRIYADDGSGAAGQVAQIARGGLRNGYVVIDRVWDTAKHVLPPRRHEPSILQYVGIDEDNGASEPYEQTGWERLPEAGDRFVMVPGTQFWIDEAPAVITVKEILADAKLRLLNTQHIAGRISSVRHLLEREGGKNLDGTPFLTFKSVPVLYVGRPGNQFVTGRSAAGFTPNLANFQLVGDHLYFPRQFGPLNEKGEDIFEQAVRDAFGERVRFVDTWDAYHRQFGEVHCATNVLREHFDFDWWTRMRAHSRP